MRRAVIALVAIVMTTVATAQTKMNAKDSAAYAVGTDFARMVQGFDSTLNLNLIVQGLQEAFAGKAILTTEAAGRAIQNFMRLKQDEQQKQTLVQMEKLAVEAAAFLDSVATQPGVSKTSSGLLYKIEKMGGERLPQEGDMVTVHYTLKLPDGTVVDSSYDNGEPLTYPNVKGQMIAGFTEGLQLLGEGGKATLYLPPSLAYGEYGSGEIQPNQALIFEVALLAITPKK